MSRWLNMLKKRGFTLIELLVVIAIIAILAAILIPAVNNALIKGAMAKTASDGRSIYLSVFSRDLDNVVLSDYSGDAFPSSTKFTTSKDYFVFLVTNKILNVPFGFFAAKGVQPAKSTGVQATDIANFSGTNVAWRVTADINESTPDGIPFLFTRNLEVKANLSEAKQGIDLQTILATQPATQNPFSKKGLVVVTKGGSSFYLQGDQIKAENFITVGGSTNDYKVLPPMNGM